MSDPDQEAWHELTDEMEDANARIKDLEEALRKPWSETAIHTINEEVRVACLPQGLSFSEKAELVLFRFRQRGVAIRILHDDALARIDELKERLHKCDGMANEINCIGDDNRRLRTHIKTLEEERGAVIAVLDPNMPESGPEDAARQVMQALVTLTDIAKLDGARIEELEVLLHRLVNEEPGRLSILVLRENARATLAGKGHRQP